MSKSEYVDISDLGKPVLVRGLDGFHLVAIRYTVAGLCVEVADRCGYESKVPYELVSKIQSPVKYQKTISVVEVKQQGQRLFLASTSCLDSNALTSDQKYAIDLTNLTDFQIDRIVYSVAVILGDGEKDEIYAKSGVRSESLPEIVTFKVISNNHFEEIDRKVARGYYRSGL